MLLCTTLAYRRDRGAFTTSRMQQSALATRPSEL
jgi:hypothetical protein